MVASLTASLTAGIVLGLSAGFSPGPFLTLVIAQSIAHGAREGAKVAIAPLVTDIPIILLSLFVLTRLDRFHIVLAGISLAGGLFLLYLAAESFRTTGFDPQAQQGAPQSLRKGVLLNFLNPHPYLFWMTVGSPILVQGWTEGRWTAAGFLAGFYGCLVGSKMVIAASVGSSRYFFLGRPYVYTMRFLGACLVFFALMLFWNALRLL